VNDAADEVQRDGLPWRNARTIREYYQDWRQHDCEGFSESMSSLCHKFTILVDAHLDLQRDANAFVHRKLLCRQGGKLTVALFAKELNEIIIPAHSTLLSALVGKNKHTPWISHTVAWRFMHILGLKFGSLRKGFIQDHERKDVVAKRKQFVQEWMILEPRMLCWRFVDVQKAKNQLHEMQSVNTFHSKEKLIQSLKLEVVNNEAPTAAEMKSIHAWAEEKCTNDVKMRLESATVSKLCMHADKFANTGDDDILGPITTHDGVYAQWVTKCKGRFTRLRCFKNGKRWIPPQDKRPILVAMHDEAIVRHKDIGRHGWTHTRLASQVYKDDGCGRMLSDYFLDQYGPLLLNKEETAAVNCKRAKKNKKPLRFGTLSPPDGSSIKLGDWLDEDIRKELTWLNEERAKAAKEEIDASWCTSTCKLDYGKNRDQYWRNAHMALHLEQYHDMFQYKCPEHELLVIKDNSSGKNSCPSWKI
jgi:hypothetical protein